MRALTLPHHCYISTIDFHTIYFLEVRRPIHITERSLDVHRLKSQQIEHLEMHSGQRNIAS